ncbi:DUF4236 domain-containing protein [Aminivibrio sp.]|jgi:hypothetical protein|uniref:DUF4236 domain-containing protein n=1 Tax=Aminivibrio sp. TaxID=1872489 RepID=UPI00169F8F68|nr:DUF4236 domain-containing protein [Synergistaceae bacterium]
MGIRFRKSITIAPGVRINLSKSGVSATLGVKGASLGIGKGGVHANVGLPGSGIFYRKKLPLPWPGKGKSGSSTSSKEVSGQGNEGSVEQMNAAIQEIIDIHLRARPSHEKPEYIPADFGEPLPALPPAPVPLWVRILVLVAAVVLVYHTKGLSFLPWAAWEGFIYWSRKKRQKALLEDHEERRKQFEKAEAERAVRFTENMERAGDDPEGALEAAISAIDWPRETRASFQVDGDRAFLDVDLPEIEDMPPSVFSWSKRNGLSENPKSETRLRKDYARHVHGVALLLMGECFRSVPAIREVILSGFTQKVRGDTGRTEDQYLYSVRALREQWDDIDFRRLNMLDPVAVLEGFELRRDMTKTGIFKAIEPFSLQ